MMIMTILEGNAPIEQARRLQQAYRDGITNLPPSIQQTFLVHSAAGSSVWRIITIWKSPEALEEMRQQGTPAGVLMFRAAGTEPTLSRYEVVEQSQA